MPSPSAAIPGDPGVPSPDLGLAHVATVSFLAGRAAPSGVFWISLAGGVALARAAVVGSARRGYGAAAGAMLQTVAVMGPARFNGPLTQALTAPVLGVQQARGHGLAAQLAACFAIRLAHYAVLAALYVWVVLGGLDAYVGSYDALTGWTGLLPGGETAALALGALGNVAGAIVFTTIQVLVYRRALASWPAGAGPGAAAPATGGSGPAAAAPAGAGAGTAPAMPAPAGASPSRAGGRRFDPRALALAAVVACALLLSGTAWALLAAVAAWLAVAWVVARAGRDAVALGLALAALLATGALTGSLLAGLGLDQALRRAVRAALLVAVATWLRGAAGPEGLRTVFRRVLHRLRAAPAAREAAAVLDGLDPGPRLIGAGRALLAAVADVPRRPLPIADAVLAWVAAEARAFRAGPGAGPAPRVAMRARDGALVALALAPALVLVGG